MYCIKCGRELSDDQRFCPGCGLKVGETEFTREEEPAGQNRYDYNTNNNDNSYSKGSYSYGNGNNGYNQYNAYNAYNGYNTMVKPVSFVDAVKNFYKGYLDFNGRATRAEYWYVILFNLIVGMTLGIPASFFAGMGNMTGYWIIYGISLIISLINLIPGIAVAIRRLHDTGRSGVWYLVAVIPLFGMIVFILLMCLESDMDNMYGPRKTM